MSLCKTPYKRHRFPPDIIQYAVWAYYRFNLSFRDVEDLLVERGIVVSYEPTGGHPVMVHHVRTAVRTAVEPPLPRIR